MYARAWRGGSGSPSNPARYGIRFSKADRDRFFERSWDSVHLELEDGPSVTVRVTDSFWRSCTEVRSAWIGRWLLDAQAAPWSKGMPPVLSVEPAGARTFRVRMLPIAEQGAR